ncbi:MAG: hypothetical protein RLY97_870, partial [Pseudomonadota bacterium]
METQTVAKGAAITAASDTHLLLLNAPLIATRLGYPDLNGLDILELFAFIYPARFLVPTPRGLAHFLGIPQATSEDAIPQLLQTAAAALLATCAHPDWPEREGAWTALQNLARLRWPWARILADHILTPAKAERWLFARLPEWDESADRPQPAQITLNDQDVRAKLATLTGIDAETRPGQRAYASQAAAIFAPRSKAKRPHMLLAEAGTGTGKTLGYLA